MARARGTTAHADDAGTNLSLADAATTPDAFTPSDAYVTADAQVATDAHVTNDAEALRDAQLPLDAFVADDGGLAVVDAGAPTRCGDGTCDARGGETCISCPIDCGARLDVDQSAPAAVPTIVNVGQSWTATRSGDLARLDVWIDSTSGERHVVLDIFEGDVCDFELPCSRDPILTLARTFDDGWPESTAPGPTTFLIPPGSVYVINGRHYTFRLRMATFPTCHIDLENRYPGGRAFLDATTDLRLATYVVAPECGE